MNKIQTILNYLEKFNPKVFGVYLIYTQNSEVELLFPKILSGATLINCPFPNAIKIQPQIKKLGRKSVINLIREINELNITDEKIDEFGFFDQMAIVLFSEIKVRDNLVIETAGASWLTVEKIMKFCLDLTNIFPHKNIFLVTPKYSDMIFCFDGMQKLDYFLFTEIKSLGLSNYINSLELTTEDL